MKFSYSKSHFLDPRQNFMDPCYVDVGLGSKCASGIAFIFFSIQLYIYIFSNIKSVNYGALIIGVVGAIIVYTIKYISQKYQSKIKFPLPAELVVVSVNVFHCIFQLNPYFFGVLHENYFAIEEDKEIIYTSEFEISDYQGKSYRRCCSQIFLKIVVRKNFAIFSGKHLCCLW